MRSFAWKRVLITGAGSGLGRELSLAFSDAGAHVVVTDINATGLAETAKLVQEAGGSALALTMDVTDASSVGEVRQQLHQSHGPIDVLVNNAGIVRGGSFLDVSVHAHRKTLEVNTVGTVIVTHAFLPDLIAQPEGHCVNIVSACGMIPLPHGATYAASKWATLGLSDSIREELRGAGHRHVGVTAVCPGLIDTELFAESRDPQFMPRLKVSRVAGQIVRAVRADKPYLLTPWQVRLIPICKAILPLWVGQWIFDWLGVATMHSMLGPRTHPTTGLACPPDPLFPGCATEPPASPLP